MRVLLADSLGDSALAALHAIGAEVTVLDQGSGDLKTLVPGYDVLVVRSTKVTQEVIEAGDKLGLIVRAGAGTDTIDTTAAASRGVFVSNVPGRNSIAVAELTMGLLLAIDRSIVDAATELRHGKWDKARYSKAEGLAGKTMGIIGLGSIGLEVAQRAKAFGIHVVAVRRQERSSEIERGIRSHGIRLVDSLDELLAESDIVSIHVPGGAATDQLVNADFLNKIADGAVLLNTSRGSTIDEAALLAAIDTKQLRVGLDVYPGEPTEKTAEFDSPLASHPNVVGSHHIGASTDQAQRSIVDGTIEVIQAYQQGSLLHCVNLQQAPERAASIIVRHIDQVGVLAEVLAVLREYRLNVQEMTNRVFAGASAAVATIDVAVAPTDEAVTAIQAIEPVVGVLVQEHA